MIKKAQSRLQLSHNRANIDYWNHLHTRRVPFPDMEFPDTLKKHIHSDTLLHLKKHHEQHDKFIKKARSQINTRLSKRVVNEKLRKDRYRQMIVNRSSGKSQSARGRRSNHQDSKLRQHEPQYSVFKRKQKKIYNTHFTEEKDLIQPTREINVRGSEKLQKKSSQQISKAKLKIKNYKRNKHYVSTGFLSRADLQVVLNKREYSPIRQKRPQSAPSKRAQVVRNMKSDDSTCTERNKDGSNAPIVTTGTKTGGAVLLPLSPSVQMSLRKARRNLTRIVAEDIATRETTEYNKLLKYLKNENLQELAYQEIKEELKNHTPIKLMSTDV